jgi:hypothetical protein
LLNRVSSKPGAGQNAALELARTGYIQELFVLIRTIIECTTHIEFVLSSRNSDGNLEPDAAKYVEAYFSDFVRNGAADDKRPQVRQRTVHRTVGARLDSATGEEAVPMVPADILMSNVYLNLSNFVHARYPEVMDLYGGVPGHFHFRGMSGTPKDAEIIENLETYVTTVSLTLKTIASELKMLDLVAVDSALCDWFRSNE